MEAVEAAVGAVVVVEVNMEVAEGRDEVASFMRPQIPLLSWLTASPTAAVDALAAAATPSVPTAEPVV